MSARSYPTKQAWKDWAARIASLKAAGRLCVQCERGEREDGDSLCLSCRMDLAARAKLRTHIKKVNP